MSLHPFIIQEPAQMLRNLRTWLEKAKSYATEKKFDPDSLLTARLAPDQFPLVRQIQSACDGAKLNAARLSDKEAPVHPDTEATIDELLARIDSVAAFLDSISAADLVGAEERKISLKWMQGKHVLGADFAREFAVPNFFFHINHAYAILRHNGVPLGKFDYIGKLSMKD